MLYVVAVSAPGTSVPKQYTLRHRHVLDERLPPLLERLANGPQPEALADLGCGDGQFLWALSRRGWLGPIAYAVDLAPERVDAVAAVLPGVIGVVSDTTDVRRIPSESLDVAISSQVIEHIPDDRALAPELARILKPGGRFYVGSVLKAPRGWWIYRRNGRWLLDPTHVREYSSHEGLVRALRHDDLVVEQAMVSPFRFPVADLALRAATMCGVLSPQSLSSVYRNRPRTARLLRAATLRPPGYSVVEVVGTRR